MKTEVVYKTHRARIKEAETKWSLVMPVNLLKYKDYEYWSHTYCGPETVFWVTIRISGYLALRKKRVCLLKRSLF